MLGLYLGTTAFVWLDTIIHNIYLNRRLKKEGFKFTSNKYFGIFDLILIILYIIVHSIPVVNLIFPIMHINKDRSYDEYMNYLEEAGAIEQVESLIDNKEELKKQILEVSNSKLMERTNSSGHIYYSPMYRGEDEEKEKVYKKVLK